MSWLDRLNDRQTRRLLRTLRGNAMETRDLARHHFDQFAHQAGDVAGRTAHQVADYGRNTALVAASDAARQVARRAGVLAGETVGQGWHEGALVAAEAARQARRISRAVRADPLPVVVGVVGVALVASLLLSRRHG